MGYRRSLTFKKNSHSKKTKKTYMKKVYCMLVMTIVIFNTRAQTPKAIITLNDSINNRKGELYQIKFDNKKWKTISYSTTENGKTSYFIHQFDSLENSRWMKYFPKPIYDFDIFENGNIVALVEGHWNDGGTPTDGTYLYTIVNNNDPSQVDTSESTLLVNRKSFARLLKSKITIKGNVMYFGGVRDVIAGGVLKLDNMGNTIWGINTPHLRSMEKFNFDKNHVVVNGESYQGTCQGCNMNITRLDTLDGTLVNELEYLTVIDSTLQEINRVDSTLIVTHKVMISSVPGLRIAGYVRKDYTRYDDYGWTIIGTNTSKDTLAWENKIPGKLISSVVVSTSAGFITVEDSNETDGKHKKLIKYHPNQEGRILWDKTDKKSGNNQRTDGSTFFDAEGLIGLTKKGKDTLVGIAYVGNKMRVTFYDTSGTCIGKYEQDLRSILPGSNTISGVRKPSFSVGEQDTYAGTTIRNESGNQRGVAFRIDYNQTIVSINSTIIGIIQTGQTITSTIVSSTSSQTVLGITTITSFVSLNQITTILGSGSTTSEVLSIPGVTTISDNITITGLLQTIESLLLPKLMIWPNPLPQEEFLHIDDISLGTNIDIYDAMGQLLLQKIYQEPFAIKLPPSLVFIKVGNQPMKKLIIH